MPGPEAMSHRTARAINNTLAKVCARFTRLAARKRFKTVLFWIYGLSFNLPRSRLFYTGTRGLSSDRRKMSISSFEKVCG
jgi:hypothetical protein